MDRADTRSAIFPFGWTEWNGKYRDCVRKFWKGDGGTVNEFATRLVGSSDLYAWSGRLPYASINFITCHDGFCLQDLVSYNGKHNEANGEDNRDGANDNGSWNCGAEGPTDDRRHHRTCGSGKSATSSPRCSFSQGVPMLLAGDELSHTQGGNNNTYCQDNELSWLDWNLDDREAKLSRLRSAGRPHLERAACVSAAEVFPRPAHSRHRNQGPFVVWSRRPGNVGRGLGRGLCEMPGVRLAGDEIGDQNERGEPLVGDTILLLLNAHHEPIPFASACGSARASLAAVARHVQSKQ